ncbi:MAG TPA: hypothetical protein DCF33_01670 [Saprospirales bacterium]|nr:hypothetical protein [Saprospirales bacterium]
MGLQNIYLDNNHPLTNVVWVILIEKCLILGILKLKSQKALNLFPASSGFPPPKNLTQASPRRAWVFF